ncbi:MAG: protoheme IX farnesyltransferase [Sphingobacteriia bacterium]|jgi:protoheme IX farnesyltransferase|nr:protoheme IX farnesyltransferase [Sphingobacteriia bacterium]
MSATSLLPVPYSKTVGYGRLLKAKLSLLVVFSALVTYLTVATNVSWYSIIGLVIGGFLITGASNGLNQIIEIKTDALMERTQNRPLPQHVLSHVQALVFTCCILIAGIWVLWNFSGMRSALLGLLSVVLYVCVYTPLKRITPFSVLIGAFPGALPTLIGGVAASSSIEQYRFSMVLFFIQFFWQFPHFWALAWFNHDDYARAGFHLLPSKGGKDAATRFQILFYTSILLPVSVLPFALGFTGVLSTLVAVICGIALVIQAYIFYRLKSDAQAKKLFFVTLIYLPLVQLAFITHV